VTANLGLLLVLSARFICFEATVVLCRSAGNESAAPFRQTMLKFGAANLSNAVIRQVNCKTVKLLCRLFLFLENWVGLQRGVDKRTPDESLKVSPARALAMRYFAQSSACKQRSQNDCWDSICQAVAGPSMWLVIMHQQQFPGDASEKFKLFPRYVWPSPRCPSTVVALWTKSCTRENSFKSSRCSAWNEFFTVARGHTT